jgi:nicotinamidase-related amidase
MPQRNLFRAEGAAVLIIDMQQRFAPAIPAFDRLVSKAAILARGAEVFDIPVLATEQYPQGLGPTVSGIADAVTGFAPMEKTCFSCAGAPGFLERLNAAKIRRVALCGVETHVCVNQTAHDLCAAGLEVHVAADAVGSRHVLDHDIALRKMQQAGALLTTVEMCLFELAGRAGTPRFKEIQKMII